MIHIVFNEADVAVLQKAIAENESIQGRVELIKDDYAVGPIGSLYTEQELESRENFWKEVYAGTDVSVNFDENTNAYTLQKISADLDSDPVEQLWIWAAQNKHDVSGYYYILPYLKAFSGRVQIVYLNNLPFLNDKGGIFYPKWLSEIPVKEFAKAKKLARVITASEWELDPDEWDKLMREDKGVRLLEGGKKLVQKEYDFYDAELMQFISNDFQKFPKVFNNYNSKAKEVTADNYIIWRLHTLAGLGKLEIQGSGGPIKNLEIKKLSVLTDNKETAEQ